MLQGFKPASEMSHCGADPFLDFSVTDLPLSGLLQPENLENPPNIHCGPAFHVLVSLGWEAWTTGLWEALMQGPNPQTRSAMHAGLKTSFESGHFLKEEIVNGRKI